MFDFKTEINGIKEDFDLGLEKFRSALSLYTNSIVKEKVKDSIESYSIGKMSELGVPRIVSEYVLNEEGVNSFLDIDFVKGFGSGKKFNPFTLFKTPPSQILVQQYQKIRAKVEERINYYDLKIEGYKRSVEGFIDEVQNHSSEKINSILEEKKNEAIEYTKEYLKQLEDDFGKQVFSPKGLEIYKKARKRFPKSYGEFVDLENDVIREFEKYKQGIQGLQVEKHIEGAINSVFVDYFPLVTYVPIIKQSYENLLVCLDDLKNSLNTINPTQVESVVNGLENLNRFISWANEGLRLCGQRDNIQIDTTYLERLTTLIPTIYSVVKLILETLNNIQTNKDFLAKFFDIDKESIYSSCMNLLKVGYNDYIRPFLLNKANEYIGSIIGNNLNEGNGRVSSLTKTPKTVKENIKENILNRVKSLSEEGLDDTTIYYLLLLNGELFPYIEYINSYGYEIDDLLEWAKGDYFNPSFSYIIDKQTAINRSVELINDMLLRSKAQNEIKNFLNLLNAAGQIRIDNGMKANPNIVSIGDILRKSKSKLYLNPLCPEYECLEDEQEGVDDCQKAIIDFDIRIEDFAWFVKPEDTITSNTILGYYIDPIDKKKYLVKSPFKSAYIPKENYRVLDKDDRHHYVFQCVKFKDLDEDYNKEEMSKVEGLVKTIQSIMERSNLVLEFIQNFLVEYMLGERIYRFNGKKSFHNSFISKKEKYQKKDLKNKAKKLKLDKDTKDDSNYKDPNKFIDISNKSYGLIDDYINLCIEMYESIGSQDDIPLLQRVKVLTSTYKKNKEDFLNDFSVFALNDTDFKVLQDKEKEEVKKEEDRRLRSNVLYKLGISVEDLTENKKDKKRDLERLVNLDRKVKSIIEEYRSGYSDLGKLKDKVLDVVKKSDLDIPMSISGKNGIEEEEILKKYISHSEFIGLEILGMDFLYKKITPNFENKVVGKLLNEPNELTDDDLKDRGDKKILESEMTTQESLSDKYNYWSYMYWLKHLMLDTLCGLPNLVTWFLPAIKLPVIYLPILVLRVDTVAIVIGIGIAGIGTYPLIIIVNTEAKRKSWMFPLTMAVESVYNLGKIGINKMKKTCRLKEINEQILIENLIKKNNDDIRNEMDELLLKKDKIEVYIDKLQKGIEEVKGLYNASEISNSVNETMQILGSGKILDLEVNQNVFEDVMKKIKS